VSYVSGLRCMACHCAVATEPFRYHCPECGGFLDVEYDYDRMREDLTPSRFENRRGTILEQWLEFLPIERPELISRVTLGEQPTPMTRALRLPGVADGARVWLKNESLFPTGSLKDRSMPLATLKALELGRAAIGTVSSGNAAASLAAYAARAGLRGVVFISKHASAGKLYKSMIHRPLGIQVLAPHSDVEVFFEQACAEFGFFDGGGPANPYRGEGMKTFAYEVARDLGWKSPQTIYMPVAYGGNFAGTWKGFKELKRLGFIDSLPAMVAAQPAVIAPIERAFRLGLSRAEPVADAETMATAVAVSDPVFGGERVLSIVRESGGAVVAVAEAEIAAAVRLLAEREGLAVEPAAALGLAAMLKLVKEDSPLTSGCQVISLTGLGLNDQAWGSAMVTPPAQAPADYEAVRAILRQAL
jgi:threonine synthase